MTAKLVDLPTPNPAKKPMSPTKSVFVIVFSMFVLGIALGSCSLGMKLPVALYDMAVGQK